MKASELSYHELIQIPSYLERFEYLKLNGKVAERTFGGRRQLNQILYQSPDWQPIRRKVIIRDNGCDLAHQDYQIHNKSRIYIHHINPITVEDILNHDKKIYDLDNLICVSFRTHQAIHYGDSNQLGILITRQPNDTCEWRR